MNFGKINRLSYVYSFVAYWTISPANFLKNAGHSTIYGINEFGGFSEYWESDSHYVRPVINLKVDVEISGGIGTINDLYTIKEKS